VLTKELQAAGDMLLAAISLTLFTVIVGQQG